jgi:phosphoglycerate dehydrogenase-like enzyme
VVDLQALTAALEDGKLGGAGLDVFEEEPLPPDHPLWQMDNVIITPHLAGMSTYLYQEERRVELLVENMRRFLANEPLLNELDKVKGYVVNANA